MPDTTIIKLTAPTLTGLTATAAYTDSQLNDLTTSAPLTRQQTIHITRFLI